MTMYPRNITAICHCGDDRSLSSPLDGFDRRFDEAEGTKGAGLQCKSVPLTFDCVLWSPPLLPLQKRLVHCPTKQEYKS